MEAKARAFLIAAVLLAGCSEKNRPANRGAPDAGQPSARQADGAGDATNTARNERDRDGVNPTADDQSESKQDIDIAAKVRRAVVSDKSLSTNAHNVKIITNEGQVTLRGPVDSEAEKEAIVAKAKEVAGDDRVVDELELKTAP